MDPDTGAVIGLELTPDAFEEVAETRGLDEDVTRTIDRALNDSVARGYGKDNIHSVLMLGGSRLISSVQKTAQRYFGRERVLLNRPLDAVAPGGRPPLSPAWIFTTTSSTIMRSATVCPSPAPTITRSL